MTRSRPPIALPAVLAAVIALSWIARATNHQRVTLPGHESWITTDADTLYHLRRVQRALDEGLPVAETDPFLNYPYGSAIPWPPYYTLVAVAATAPFAPADHEARRAFVERRVASLPMLFGVLTSVAAALAARSLAGNTAGLIAGGLHALSLGSIAYSKSGNGDHHAFITLFAGLMTWGLAEALARPALGRREAVARGALVGAAAGVALGSWVASLLYIVPLQAVLGWRLAVHARQVTPARQPARSRQSARAQPPAGDPFPDIPALAIAFHVAALLVLLPATLTSPWARESPWMVVDLTWFHPAWLALGATACAPFALLRGRALRIAPFAVAGALALIALFLLTSDTAPAAGVREGFRWIRRENDFMASVWESRGLFGTGAAFDPFSVLGFGLIGLPFAWAAAAWQAFRRNRFELLPWAVTVPLLTLQAARQVRFADALALPMAVVLAWGAAEAVRRNRRRLPRALTRAGWSPWAAAALAIALGQADAVRDTARALAAGSPGSAEEPSAIVMREMCEWIRVHTAPGDWCVLAGWNWGHTIEWAAERPSVATNFGTYVGEDSFRDPSVFLLTEDPARAETLMEARRARYVTLTSRMPETLRPMIRDVDPALEARYLKPGPGDRADLRFEWFRTMGARLMYDGAVITPDRGAVGALGFLRLVHVSPRRDPRPNPRGEPSPAGWVWERVSGAIVEVHGAAGEEARLDFRVRYAAGGYAAEWTYTGVCGDDGVARIRVPLATDEPNGDGVVERAAWHVGEREGTLAVPEAAVTRGDPVAAEEGPLGSR